MNTKHMTCLDIKLEGQAWMQIANPEVTVEQAVEKLKSLGNVIVEVDEANRRVKCMDVSEYPFKEVFICEKCGAYSIREAVTVKHESTCQGELKQ